MSKGLETADQIASVVGGASGLISVALSVAAYRGSVGAGQAEAADRVRSRYGSLALTLVCLAAAALAAVRLTAAKAGPVPVVVGCMALFCAVVVVAFYRARRWWRSPVPLPAPLREVLRHQMIATEKHAYPFWDLCLPDISRIYVEQRADVAQSSEHTELAGLTPEQMLGRFGICQVK